MSALPSKGFKIAAIALREQWSLKGTQPVPIDFGIWDQKTVWHYEARGKAKVYFGKERETEINRYKAIFNNIWAKAEPHLEPTNNCPG